MAIAVLLPPTTLPAGAETGDRTLYLYHTHTHETARITFKRNGVYDQKGLQQLDWFLRDFRNNQPTEMAPQLFDLVWEVYQKVGATQPINIVSAYRSPETNALLRAHSNGVASHSQHMLGHAMDFFIPGIPLTTLRATGMLQQVGGVGFYPNSGSPFVHMDVGTVRAWPLMTTAQLRSIFPDGKTLHTPAGGPLLSQAGYAYAQTQWNSCHAVPCTNPAALKGGPAVLGHDTMVAAATTSATGKTFTDIFRGVNPGNLAIRPTYNPDIASPVVQSASADASDDDSDQTAGPAQVAVTTVAVAAPIPLARPMGPDDSVTISPQRAASSAAMTLAAAAAVPFDSLFPSAYDPNGAPAGAANGNAPIPAQKPYGLMVATGELSRNARPQSALGAIASIETPIPAARLARTDDVAITAYAPIGPGTSAEQQLQTLIENETTGTAAQGAPGSTGLTNSVGTPLGVDALKGYAEQHRTDPGRRQSPAAILALASFTARDAKLIAPGFAEGLVQPVAMTSSTFAVFSEPSATDLNPATELGPMVAHFGFKSATTASLAPSQFGAPNPLLVASR
ncbi:MAG: DUF882 domain-containing protein [Devosia sp.]